MKTTVLRGRFARHCSVRRFSRVAMTHTVSHRALYRKCVCSADVEESFAKISEMPLGPCMQLPLQHGVRCWSDDDDWFRTMYATTAVVESHVPRCICSGPSHPCTLNG